MLGEIGEEVIGVRRVGREILPTDESLLSRMNCETIIHLTHLSLLVARDSS